MLYLWLCGTLLRTVANLSSWGRYVRPLYYWYIEKEFFLTLKLQKLNWNSYLMIVRNFYAHNAETKLRVFNLKTFKKLTYWRPCFTLGFSIWKWLTDPTIFSIVILLYRFYNYLRTILDEYDNKLLKAAYSWSFWRKIKTTFDRICIEDRKFPSDDRFVCWSRARF